MKDEKALQIGAAFAHLLHSLHQMRDVLAADGVVAARVVVRGVLFAGEQLLGMEELPIGARAHLVYDARLEVDEDGARHIFARRRLREERAERVVLGRVVGRDLATRRYAVLHAVQLPARVADLHARLADMNRNDLSHDDFTHRFAFSNLISFAANNKQRRDAFF